ncbi:MAG TPA: CHAD domain-containing protein [Candidatus Limnocylindria bacterium]|nr:CHAD domain-containing protein [Candidatus Limnocylindria bacterium]
MAEAASKMERPALDVVARIARRQLGAAGAAAARLQNGEDGDALHDFRVAIRRLRSTLRAYRSHLRGVVRPKDRRRLRRLAEATGPARDAEVQVERLRALRRELDGETRALASRMIRRLRRHVHKGYADARTVIEARFPRAARALEKRLRDAGTFPDALPFRLVLGRLIALHTDTLRPLLEELPALRARRRLHRARIETKRLRYLLEPVARKLPASTLVVHRLAHLQDLLGELHDFQVLEQTLATEDGGTALAAIRRLVRARQRRAYQAVAAAAGGANAAKMLAPLDLLVQRLGAGRRPALPLRRAVQPAARRAVVSAARS